MKYPEVADYVFYVGEKFRVEFYYNENGELPVKEYFDKSSHQVQVKLLALVKYIAENGTLFDEEKFRIVGKKDKIYEFKPVSERFFSFFTEGRRIIITNAYPKKGQKVNPRELKKAIEIKEDYRLRIKGGDYYGS